MPEPQKSGGILIEDCHGNDFHLQIDGFANPLTIVRSHGNQVSGAARTEEVALAETRAASATEFRRLVLDNKQALSDEQFAKLLVAAAEIERGGEARETGLGKVASFCAEVAGTALGAIFSGLIGKL